MSTKPTVLNIAFGEATVEDDDENASASKEHASSIYAVWQPDVLNIRFGPESSPITYTRLKFSPLIKPTEIRLLQLIRASDGSWAERQPLSLCNVDLEHNPEYVCLSYAWGSIDEIMPVFLDEGQYLMVTKSLGEFLFACNTKQEEVLFWADQICIDQYNPEERAAQVRIMSRIYSQALTTYVWLGRSDEHTIAAFNVIEKCKGRETSWLGSEDAVKQSNFMGEIVDPDVAEHWSQHIRPCRRSILQECKRKIRLKARGKLFRNTLQPQEWQAFESLINKPWFSRLWIFQEFVVSKDVVFLCGPHDTRAAHLWQAVTHLPTPTYYKLPTGWHTIYELVIRKLEYQDSKTALLGLLYASRLHFKCGNPRDRIFALLSLAGEAEIQVDYSISVVELYSNVTKFLINRSQRLDVLDLVRDQPDDARIALPSWTPDFNQDQLIPTIDYFRSDEKRFNASAGCLHIYQEETSRQHLTVRGKIVDQLLGILSPGPIARRDVPGHIEDIGRLLLLPEILDYLDKRIGANESSLQTSISAKRLILQTITCDGFSRDDRYTASPPNDEEIKALWEISCDSKAAIQKHTTAKYEEWQEHTSKANVLLNIARKLKHHNELDAFRSYMNWTDQEKMTKWLQMSRWVHMQTLNAEGRVIIASKRSEIILGPANSQPKDLICILAGSTVPWILRPKKKTENQYQLIGPCFAEGFMYGEKAHRIEQDTETFVLV